ncbi:putative mRNA-splicing protein ubp10 [Cyphellophora attinorum]|uniref:Putative mRNA-splicing protein ubp10 n=1 Tax=Cyphellophora attinorum TaxID=1664694 RepID=A0A0N1HHJ8_9EURO|nr:putative mRNA-splicing protein ubp10 [Phialophora attinorum]KPI45510.1 putative mRNA-splicing protein ubp10 [Phialophora attinorum]
MAKRRSEEPLDSVAIASPANKKARVEEVVDEALPIPPPPPPDYETTQGHSAENEDADTDEDEGTGGEDVAGGAALRQNAPLEGYSDLYLDTINRSVLDFDFEKLCSVTLSNINVYACLVCGKYFQGRGPKSHAYFHALEVDHHVYINMETKKVYVLPEGYEVHNKSLEDIKYVVDPKFDEEEVRKLDKVPKEAVELSNKRYRPGYIGMNNIKANDYLNVVVQALSHVAPLRNFFLLNKFSPTSPQLPVRFSTMVRKIWNPKAFRNHVSPHELLQEIALRSSKKFTLTQQSDPVEFLSWFLNNLHLTLGGSKTKPMSSIIQLAFQGKLRLESQAITAKSDATGDRLRFEESSNISINTTPYMILTLDLPPTPLFRDAVEDKNIIPHVPLTSLLQKYNGIQASERQAHRVRHRLLHPLPPFLMFHIKRFSINKFVSERNPTIVTFPSPIGLDMSPFVEPNPSIYPPGEPIYYELVANIILDTINVATGGGEDSNAADAANKAVGGEGDKVAWKVQLRDKAVANSQRSDLPEWVEIQDLFVERAEAETLFTREGYLMIWERRKEKSKGANGTTNGVGNGKARA